MTDKEVVDILQREFNKRENSAQKIAVLMILFGKRFWEVIDHFRKRPE
jgi:hypothetical protein